MTAVMMKNKKVQPILLNGLQPPPPPVYYSEEMTVEVIEEIEVTVWQED